MNGQLSGERRRQALDTMAGAELDVLVVGGGVVGAGVALDVVSRGLNVGLVEARDWAVGTSSRSSNLIHGGLRNLERLEFGLVRQALRERSLLLDRLAPHLVRRVPFLYPLHRHAWDRAYVGAGLLLYDGLARFPGQPRLLPPHRHLAVRRVGHIAPALRLDGVTGAVQYYDAQTDDGRFVLTLVRTAAAYGAQVANAAVATGLLRNGDRVVGVRVRDALTGASHEIRARVVVSAVGVWTPRLLADLGTEAASTLRIRTSKGVHLVVPRDRIRSSTGVITRTADSALFFIPRGHHWILGTTETPWRLDVDHPVTSARDIEYLLDQANRHLVTPLAEDDVVGCYAGLRPLVFTTPARRNGAGGTAAVWSPSNLSGEHLVRSPVPGLVVLAGGTFTNYRLTAAEAGDAAARQLSDLVEPSVTNRLPLLGADGYHARWNQRHLLARRAGLHVARVEHMLQRYGSLADDLLDMISTDPGLGEPVPGGEDYVAAELVYAASHEGALELADIVARRTRIASETRDRGATAARYAARLVAQTLGWDHGEQSEQVGRYLRRVEAERLSATKWDDSAAVSALGSAEAGKGRPA